MQEGEAGSPRSSRAGCRRGKPGRQVGPEEADTDDDSPASRAGRASRTAARRRERVAGAVCEERRERDDRGGDDRRRRARSRGLFSIERRKSPAASACQLVPGEQVPGRERAASARRRRTSARGRAPGSSVGEEQVERERAESGPLPARAVQSARCGRSCPRSRRSAPPAPSRRLRRSRIRVATSEQQHRSRADALPGRASPRSSTAGRGSWRRT